MPARGLLVAAFFLLATPAWAQFAECPVPSSVPSAVFETLLDEANVSFGDLSSGICNSIANKGKAICRTQTNAAASCLRRSIEAVYEIGLKQCNELENPARSECKDELKDRRDDDRDGVRISQDDGLELCNDELEDAVRGACEGLVKG